MRILSEYVGDAAKKIPALAIAAAVLVDCGDVSVTKPNQGGTNDPGMDNMDAGIDSGYELDAGVDASKTKCDDITITEKGMPELVCEQQKDFAAACFNITKKCDDDATIEAWKTTLVGIVQNDDVANIHLAGSNKTVDAVDPITREVTLLGPVILEGGKTTEVCMNVDSTPATGSGLIIGFKVNSPEEITIRNGDGNLIQNTNISGNFPMFDLGAHTKSCY